MPLRQPLDSAIPNPATSSLPSALGLHTSAQVFMLPRSSPTIMLFRRAMMLRAVTPLQSAWFYQDFPTVWLIAEG